MLLLRKLSFLLNSSQRRSAAILLGLMMIGTVLEMLGIGLVIPALALMTTPDIAARYPVLSPWLARLGNPSQAQLVMGGMLALAAIYTFKSMFFAFLAWRQARFVFGVRASLSKELYAGYLRQPYTFHLQRNSAQLISNAITETSQLTQGGLIVGFLIISEVFVFVGIVALLFIVQPLGAVLVASILILAGWGFSRMTKSWVLRWGTARQVHEQQRLQHLQQGLGGAKDVKLLGREQDFLDQYDIHNEGSARMARRATALDAMPRLAIELLAVVGLAALVIVMLVQGKPVTTLVPILGLFAAAAFRLMPSTSRVIQSLQSLRYYLPSINTLADEIALVRQASGHAETEAGKTSLTTRWESINLHHIVFQYPGTGTPAVDDVDLRIRRGSSVGFVGGSGAGKSTLIDVILGLLTPTSGQVRLDDTDIQSHLRRWQDQIGYVPQSIYLTDDTLRRNVAFGLSENQIDDAAVRRALTAAQLTDFIGTLPDGVNTIVGERGVRLSGGQRQRIGIARALYHDPEVLVLDEATSALDLATEKSFMEAIAAFQGEKTILIVAHRLSTVANCDRIFRLDRGRLVEEGTPSALLHLSSLATPAYA